MWMLILIPLLIVLIIAIYYEYQNKKKSEVHMNSMEHEERPSQHKVTSQNQSEAGREGSQPPPT